MKNDIIVALGPSRAGKGTLAKIAVEEFGYQEVHPIEKLKYFLENLLQLSSGALSTEKGKNTVIKEYTTYYFHESYILPKAKTFFKEIFRLNNDTVLNWISWEFTNFLLQRNWEYAKDIEKALFHYFEERNCVFAQSYLDNYFKENSGKVPIVITGVRRLEEANLILDHFIHEYIAVVNIYRPGFEGLSTDHELENIKNLFKSKSIWFDNLNNYSDLPTFQTNCRYFMKRILTLD